MLFHFSTDAQLEKADYSSEAASQQMQQKIIYRGPIDDCLLSDTLYLRENKNDVHCTENYVHFFPKVAEKKRRIEMRSPKLLKIGSFNLFHLGDNQSPMKSYEIVASIINQWDLVGAQEMMPLGLDIVTENLKIAELLSQQEGRVRFPIKKWSVPIPGYLRVLKSLQKLDSSWALILQPTSEGEGGAGEMSGFYYRSARVQLLEWDYCPFENTIDRLTQQRVPNLACQTQVTAAAARLTSRVAFSALFKSGNFDFIGLTTHSRYRAALDPKDLDAQKNAVCKNHIQPEKCKIPKDQVGRFYEIFAVADQIGEMKEKATDADVIFMGDFNLEILPITLENWKASLRPAALLRPFQKEPTTVGTKFSKMVSNYDHFILDTKFTAECDAESAKSYDYIKAAARKTSVPDKLIAQHLFEKQLLAVAAERKAETDTYIKVQNLTQGAELRELTEDEKAEINSKYDESLVRMKLNNYALVLELISDHIPIEMNCKKDLPDDD